MDHQAVGDPAWGLEAFVPHQTVQPLAVHAPERVQGVLGRHHAVVVRAVGGLACQLRVPGQVRGGQGSGATGGGNTVQTLHQDRGLQGRDGDGCRGMGDTRIIMLSAILA